MRLKQQAAAEPRPAAEATIAALRRPSPTLQPLPSISPEASQRSNAQAWLPPAASAGLLGEEDEDAVLIGSVAPSFSLPRAQAAQPLLGAAAPNASPLAAQRRSSVLSAHLGSEDLSLTALAAASRRVTRYSSASGGSSLPSTQSSRGASVGADASASEPDAAAPSANGQYAADFEAESPGAGGERPLHLHGAPQPASQSAQLSSGELALLRQSLLELRLPGGLDAIGGDSSAAAAAGAQEIPDQVVLRELGAQLGRLDSAKRRVLLQVLAKLDAAPGGAEEAAPGSVALQRSSSSSSCGGRRASTAGHTATAAAADGQASHVDAGLLSRGSRASSRDGDAPPPPTAAPRLPVCNAAPAPQQAAAASAGMPASTAAPSAAASQSTGQQQSPSKAGGLMSRLAVLRLGRTSSLGKAGSVAAAAQSVAAAAQSVVSEVVPGAAALPAVPHATQAASSPRGSSLGHSTSASSLQGVVQQRQRERSRLSVDGLPSVRQHTVGPAAAVAALHGSQLTGAGGPGGGDALSAFEQQHAADEAPPALSASPTVLALGGWQQQAEQQAGSASRARSGSGGAETAAFAIPVCPSGRVLELRISSTWGDPHFVGLTGIELFDNRGQLLTVRWVA